MVMAWVIVAVVILTLLAILMWLPLELEIDSSKDVYHAGWWPVLDFDVIPNAEGVSWGFKLFNRKIQLTGAAKKEAKTAKKPAKKGRPFPTRLVWPLLKNLPRAFSVKRLSINWDTGDFVRNAHLYPLFYLWSSRSPMQLGINYMGRQEVCIHVQTRLYRLAQAFLRAYFSYKFK